MLPSTHASLSALRSQMRSAFINRDTEIDGLLTALIAESHVALLGPAGTAKSLITKVFSNAITDGSYGSYFEILMTAFTTPDEVFGGPDLAAMDRGEPLRSDTTGHLAEAEVGFIDEGFKGGPGVLNALLTILNEREFDNGGKRVKCPLKIAVLASNEYPQEDGGVSLAALYDRFQFRYWIEYLPTREQRRALLSAPDPASVVTAKLTAGEIADLQAARRAVVVPDAVIEGLLDIVDTLARDHGIVVSDRRLRQSKKLVQARAVLNGHTTATMRDLLVLTDTLWNHHEQKPAVLGTILSVAAPALQTVRALADAAREAHDAVIDYTDLNSVQKHLATVKRIEREIAEIAADSSDDPDIEHMEQEVVSLRKSLARGFVRASGLPGSLAG